FRARVAAALKRHLLACAGAAAAESAGNHLKTIRVGARLPDDIAPAHAAIDATALAIVEARGRRQVRARTVRGTQDAAIDAWLHPAAGADVGKTRDVVVGRYVGMDAEFVAREIEHPWVRLFLLIDDWLLDRRLARLASAEGDEQEQEQQG